MNKKFENISSSTKITGSITDIHCKGDGKFPPLTKSLTGKRTLFGKMEPVATNPTNHCSAKPSITKIRARRSNGLSVPKFPLKNL